MCYRVVTGKMKSGTNAEAKQIIEDNLIPALKQREGWEAFDFLVESETNEFVVIAQWASKEAANAVAEDGFEREQMGRFAHLLAGEPKIVVVEPLGTYSR